MALNVDVAGFGICKTAQPYVTFVICVQQEKFEAWTVYRRFQSFCILRDQLISHHPAIPQLAAFDHNNFNFEYLESFRDFLNRWLQSLTCNTYILRMQAMYQFLCIDANMPPPYLEIFWGNNNNQDDDEMDMNEMFEDDDHQQQQWHDDEDEPEHETMDTVFEFEQNLHQKKSPSAKSPRNGAKKRPSNPHINPSTMPVYEDENDLRDGMDIQSLSYGQAEFLYDKKDEENMNDLTRTASGRFVVPNSPSKQPEQSSLSKPKRTISLESFKIIKLIGKGSFGKVFLVRDKASGNLYAMKVLKKDYIKRKNQVEHTRTERSVLGNVRHPFIVGLNMAFQTADKLFFVLDYCSGGELFFHLGKVGRFTEERAKFYAAQITLALEYVHSLGIIYRDLKPENVLLDRNGNVRLTDFGLSKEGVLDHSSGANSFCGTPEYIAPEVILRQGHGRAVDWWSLGALLYEMITGLPPFYSRNRETMFEKIMKADLTFPNTVGEVILTPIILCMCL